MRQTETEEVLHAEAGRSLERPVFIPGVRHFKGYAGDGAECLATIDGRSVVLWRSVAGLPCRIRLTPGQYRGVAAVERSDRCIVRLIHRDPGLTIDLEQAADGEAAAEQRDRLAALLAIPAIDQPCAWIGSAKGRRAVGHDLRRPRFLKRRRRGTAGPAAKVEGREIIAPE